VWGGIRKAETMPRFVATEGSRIERNAHLKKQKTEGGSQRGGKEYGLSPQSKNLCKLLKKQNYRFRKGKLQKKLRIIESRKVEGVSHPAKQNLFVTREGHTLSTNREENPGKKHCQGKDPHNARTAVPGRRKNSWSTQKGGQATQKNGQQSHNRTKTTSRTHKFTLASRN